jgi:hypothetical protein
MMEERPLGIVVTIIGVIGLFLSLLADPLGIGEGEVFGWLQITGTIISALVTLLGIAMLMEWVPYPGRRTETVAAGGQNTTIVTERTPPPDTTVTERTPPPATTVTERTPPPDATPTEPAPPRDTTEP